VHVVNFDSGQDFSGICTDLCSQDVVDWNGGIWNGMVIRWIATYDWFLPDDHL